MRTYKKIKKNYPHSLDQDFKAWAIKQPYPDWSPYGPPQLKKTYKLDGMTHTIIAQTMKGWKYIDCKVKKGQKALFWLGNVPWWTNRQVEHIEGFKHWEELAHGRKLRAQADSLEEQAKYEGWGDDWEYEAGDAMGGPFF